MNKTAPVEHLAWHKSSISMNNANCVEVAASADDDAVLVRDTKNAGNGPVIKLSHPAWQTFLTELTGNVADPNSGIEVKPAQRMHRTANGQDVEVNWCLHQPETGTSLYYTNTEWRAFIVGAQHGEFDALHHAA